MSFCVRDPSGGAFAVRAIWRAHKGGEIVALRRQRADLLRFRSKNLAAGGLARQIRTLAGRARELLANPDDGLQRKVLDLLDVRVEVLGWDVCVTCGGNGLLSRPGPRRRSVGADDDRRGGIVVCPDCVRTRQIPALRITGQIPSLLLASIDKQDVGGDEYVGLVMPFEADIRVA